MSIRRLSNRKGETLVETVITVAILSVAIAGLMTMVANAGKINRSARLLSEAIDAQTGQLEERTLLPAVEPAALIFQFDVGGETRTVTCPAALYDADVLRVYLPTDD